MFLRQRIYHTKESIKKNRNHIVLGIFAFLALAIAFATGYITARDLTIAPIIIQQQVAE
jgi:hypothetical protein